MHKLVLFYHTDSLPQTEHPVTVTVFKTTTQKRHHVVPDSYILIFSFSNVKPEKILYLILASTPIKVNCSVVTYFHFILSVDWSK